MHKPPRILAVDDVAENREIVVVRLKAHGYEITTAADGEEGLAKARAEKPDLILLDIMMPKLDGISVLKELKRDENLGFIPVILLTAKADRRDVIAGLDAGADDYLTKPFDQAALVARVRAMLRIKALHDLAQEQALRLSEQTKELAAFNATLEARVEEQVCEIERMSRLKRFYRRRSPMWWRPAATRRACSKATGARSACCFAICAASPPSPRRPSPRR